MLPVCLPLTAEYNKRFYNEAKQTETGMTPLKTKSNIVSLDSKKMKCNRRIKWKGMDAMICAVLSNPLMNDYICSNMGILNYRFL